MDLSKAVIAVCGAGHGIGAVTCAMLRAKGATVIGSAAHAKGDIEAVDVRDFRAVSSWLQGIKKKHGKIDAVINSAGIAGERQTIQETSEQAFEDIMRVNLFGTFHVLRAALGILEKNGTIITVSSRAGHRSHPTLVSYSASKAGTLSLCQGTAKELKDAKSDILCCTVSPGGVDTRMREGLFGKEDSQSQQKPEIVAETIVKILTGELKIAQGGDVIISRGNVEVVEMA